MNGAFNEFVLPTNDPIAYCLIPREESQKMNKKKPQNNKVRKN